MIQFNNNNNSYNDNHIIKMEEQPKKEQLLTCNDIQRLEIIRKIGNGANKVAFEVKLPHSNNSTLNTRYSSLLVKRCYTLKCNKRAFIKNEATIFQGLQDQYGSDNTVQYFGGCFAASSKWAIEQLIKAENENNNSSSIIIDKIARNFSVGYTIVIDLGVAINSNRQLF